jgi:hypothetical protein
VVLIDPVLPEVVPGWSTDPDLRALVEGKESALFRLFPVSGTGCSVAVRRDLLPAE